MRAELTSELFGVKSGEEFDAHRRICAVCGPLFAEVQAGRQWLRSLEVVEPPAYLVHNILAATSGVFSTRSSAAAAAGGQDDSFWRTDAGAVGFVRLRRSRLLYGSRGLSMSFGMIFFSFSLALNAAGVKPRTWPRLICGRRRCVMLTTTRRSGW